MAFMIPAYTNEPFHSGETREGGVCVPADVYGTLERFCEETGADPESAELIEGKWWCCLSAPGYLDATEWTGPFDTLAKARADVVSTWEVHPDTGDDTDDEGGAS